MLGIIVRLAWSSLQHVGRIDAQIVAADGFGPFRDIDEWPGGAGAGGIEHFKIEPRPLAPGLERARPWSVLRIIVAAEAVLPDAA